MRKYITIHDFLTEEQVQRAIELETADKIMKEVILPNMDEINRKLGQSNNAKYLAYLCEYVIMTSKQNNKE